MSTRRHLGALALGLLAAVSAGPAQSQTKWDLSTVWPDGNFHTQNAKRFAEEVANVTGGAVAITVKGGGQLGFKGPEHLRAVRDGLVPIADVLNSQQVGDEPFLGIEVVPFLIAGEAERKILYKHVRGEMERIYEKNGQKVLYMVPWPRQYLHLKTKADKLDGLKATKVRVPDNQVQQMLNLLGMSPVLIPWGEVVPALSSGAVSGVATSATSGVDGKFWEFLKYVYLTDHGAAAQSVTVNIAAFKKLSADHQKAIVDLAAKLEPEFWAVSAKNDADSLARLRQGSMETIDIPPAMLADMREKTKPMVEDFIKKNAAQEKMVRAYLAEVKR